MFDSSESQEIVLSASRRRARQLRRDHDSIATWTDSERDRAALLSLIDVREDQQQANLTELAELRELVKLQTYLLDKAQARLRFVTSDIPSHTTTVELPSVQTEPLFGEL